MKYGDSQERQFMMLEEGMNLINGTTLKEEDVREHELVVLFPLVESKSSYDIELLKQNATVLTALDNLLDQNDCFLVASSSVGIVQSKSNLDNRPAEFIGNAREVHFDDPRIFLAVPAAVPGKYNASEADAIAAFFNGLIEFRDDSFIKVENHPLLDYKTIPDTQTSVAARNSHSGEKWCSTLFNTYFSGAGKAKIIVKMPQFADTRLIAGDPLGLRSEYGNVKTQNYGCIRLKGVLISGAAKSVAAAVLEKNRNRIAA